MHDDLTGLRVILDPEADTRAMRSSSSYSQHNADGTTQRVAPYGGAGSPLDAHWRGERGNPTRQRSIQRMARANAAHQG